jgi:hypothetical protein
MEVTMGAGFWFGLFIGAVGASIPWWIKVRGLSGVVADLKDVKSEATKVAGKV